jgi:hypothetical protein
LSVVSYVGLKRWPRHFRTGTVDGGGKRRPAPQAERKIEFTTTEKVFEPGTVVNFESQFFSPRMSGITYYIDTLMFKADTAFQPLKSPLDLVVVGD